MTYEAELEVVRNAMHDYDPEITADIACEQALNALDQLMVLAAKDETAHLVVANKVFVGQILTRAQLVASFLMTRQSRPHMVINNGQH